MLFFPGLGSTLGLRQCLSGGHFFSRCRLALWEEWRELNQTSLPVLLTTPPPYPGSVTSPGFLTSFCKGIIVFRCSWSN